MKVNDIKENIIKTIVIYGSSKLFNILRQQNDINKILPENVVFNRLNNTLITRYFLESKTDLDKSKIISCLNKNVADMLLNNEIDGVLTKFDICDIMDGIDNERIYTLI